MKTSPTQYLKPATQKATVYEQGEPLQLSNERVQIKNPTDV